MTARIKPNISQSNPMLTLIRYIRRNLTLIFFYKVLCPLPLRDPTTKYFAEQSLRWFTKQYYILLTSYGMSSGLVDDN